MLIRVKSSNSYGVYLFWYLEVSAFVVCIVVNTCCGHRGFVLFIWSADLQFVAAWYFAALVGGRTAGASSDQVRGLGTVCIARVPFYFCQVVGLGLWDHV